MVKKVKHNIYKESLVKRNSKVKLRKNKESLVKRERKKDKVK